MDRKTYEIDVARTLEHAVRAINAAVEQRAPFRHLELAEFFHPQLGNLLNEIRSVAR